MHYKYLMRGIAICAAAWLVLPSAAISLAEVCHKCRRERGRGCYCAPTPYWGYHPTCWRQWPADWCGCPPETWDEEIADEADAGGDEHVPTPVQEDVPPGPEAESDGTNESIESSPSDPPVDPAPEASATPKPASNRSRARRLPDQPVPRAVSRPATRSPRLEQPSQETWDEAQREARTAPHGERSKNRIVARPRIERESELLHDDAEPAIRHAPARRIQSDRPRTPPKLLQPRGVTRGNRRLARRVVPLPALVEDESTPMELDVPSRNPLRHLRENRPVVCVAPQGISDSETIDAELASVLEETATQVSHADDPAADLDMADDTATRLVASPAVKRAHGPARKAREVVTPKKTPPTVKVARSKFAAENPTREPELTTRNPLRTTDR